MVVEQLSLFVDDERVDREPTVDETFAHAIRRPLDDTSWIEIVPSWVTGSQTLLTRLLASISFEQRHRWMYNRLIDEPRLTAEYGDVSSTPEPFLSVLARVLSRRYGVAYDGIWLNLYRNEGDSTGWHGDWRTCKREECIVPVVSLGAARRFLLKPGDGGPSVTFAPRDGDLLVMGGRCQRNWRHCVPKQSSPAGTRISINFSSTAQAQKTP